jgi:hypothetical protein
MQPVDNYWKLYKIWGFFVVFSDGRLEYGMTYRSLTGNAAATTATLKQDCYVNTVIFCEVPRDACYRPTAPATTIRAARCCLQYGGGEPKHGCSTAVPHNPLCDRVVTSRAQAAPPRPPRTNPQREQWRRPSGQNVNCEQGKKLPLVVASTKKEKTAKCVLNKIALPPPSGMKDLCFFSFFKNTI